MNNRYVNCRRCEEIIDTVHSGEHCLCGVVLCAECDSTFYYGDEIRCFYCFHDEPDLPDVWQILDLVKRKFGMTFEDLKSEFLQTASPNYHVPRDVYECTICEPNECASKECEFVSQCFREGRRVYKGFCCKVQEKEDLCKGCQAWEARRICIAMIGARKFRKGSLLNLLPRDVLICAILKPFVLNSTIEPMLKKPSHKRGAL